MVVELSRYFMPLIPLGFCLHRKIPAIIGSSLVEPEVSEQAIAQYVRHAQPVSE